MAEEENDDMEFDDMEDVIEGLEEIEQEEETTKDSRALQYLTMHHPECRLDYMEDVAKLLPLSAYPPDNNTDKNHKSVPYLTLFEKTKLIGFRANQLAQGARPLVQVPSHVTDVIDIAKIELEEKRMPYILKRTMPDGTFEYWRLTDLLII
jgi:DNA-directed RNA polymerase I, II, and III subunit RPABC2